jgi:uncharacterized protein (DUF433 family)
MSADEIIIDRGRGPEIKGTRITVFDVLDYVLEGWHHTRIASFFRISSREVQAAMAYIEAHKAEVMADYQKILDRAARGNPPELQAKLDASHARFQELMAQVRRLREENPEDLEEKIAALIREHRESARRGA